VKCERLFWESDAELGLASVEHRPDIARWWRMLTLAIDSGDHDPKEPLALTRSSPTSSRTLASARRKYGLELRADLALPGPYRARHGAADPPAE